MAYASDNNPAFCEEHNAELYARTNSAVAAAACAQLEDGFSYSKDAHMTQCPAGHLAMRVEKRNAANGNTYYNYCFSVKKCKVCPMRDNCRVGKSKSRTYSVTHANDAHKARLEFESSEEFSGKLRIRHRIEEKNGEMKTAHIIIGATLYTFYTKRNKGHDAERVSGFCLIFFYRKWPPLKRGGHKFFWGVSRWN